MYVCICLLLIVGPAIKLEDIANENMPGGQRIKLASGQSVLLDFCADEIGECNTTLDVLELKDVYTEKYLLSFTADDG